MKITFNSPSLHHLTWLYLCEPNGGKQFGEHRTKRVILEIYDEMKRAMETGERYRTRLEPPPADLSVAHAPREKVDIHL